MARCRGSVQRRWTTFVDTSYWRGVEHLVQQCWTAKQIPVIWRGVELSVQRRWTTIVTFAL